MTRLTPIIFILLVAGACVTEIKPPSEEESTTVATQVEASPLPAPNPTIILPTVTDPTCCLGGAVGSHPAPLGYAVPLGDGRLVVGVLEVTRPANDIVARASPSNPIPISGSEYLIVKIVLQCMAKPSNTDNPCDLGLGVLFRVIDSAGTYYKEAPGLVEVPDRFELPDNINTAFTTTGNVVFLVPTSASDLVLDFSWPNNADVLLALE
jgi:hypothetical protein